MCMDSYHDILSGLGIPQKTFLERGCSKKVIGIFDVYQHQDRKSVSKPMENSDCNELIDERVFNSIFNSKNALSALEGL